jgi:hypothetical protein
MLPEIPLPRFDIRLYHPIIYTELVNKQRKPYVHLTNLENISKQKL